MKITVFGTKQDFVGVKTAIEGIPSMQYRKLVWEHMEDYDGLMNADVASELTVVTLDGAEGMEGAMLLRRTRPEHPVIWFSEDPAFGAQARRMGCAYFGRKPITPCALERAIRAAIA